VLEAVHVQPEVVVTSTLPDPPAVSYEAPGADNAKVHEVGMAKVVALATLV
jgi:hypothetical protein